MEAKLKLLIDTLTNRLVAQLYEHGPREGVIRAVITEELAREWPQRRGGQPHGSRQAYKDGCRCEACIENYNAYHREYRARMKGSHK